MQTNLSSLELLEMQGTIYRSLGYSVMITALMHNGTKMYQVELKKDNLTVIYKDDNAENILYYLANYFFADKRNA